MPTFDLSAYNSLMEEEIKGDARMSMFLALRAAFKERSTKNGVTAKALADVLKKDKGQVSRVLNGRTKTINFETLAVYLEALGYMITLKPKKVEENRPSNVDARPFQRMMPEAQSVTNAYFSGVPVAGAGAFGSAGV